VEHSKRGTCRDGVRLIVLAASALLIGITPGYAQSDAPVAMVTGYGGFTATFEPGAQTFNPVLSPILLAPIGRHVLIEGEFEMESDIPRADGVWGGHTIDKGLEYLQADFLAGPVTVVAGRFLTPFGIYNERLHPAWIKNMMNTPLILGLSEGSSTGGMVRGGASVGGGVVLNYSAYYSAPYSTENATLNLINSERSAGGRWSLFFAEQRVEAGFSIKRHLADERTNDYGGDFTWTLPHTPLDVRAEYANSAQGDGYWAEGAYRTTHVPFWSGFFRRSQLVPASNSFTCRRTPLRWICRTP